jgi:acetyl esterase/lipase
MTDSLRLVGGILFLSVAALSLVPASLPVMWGASIAATEWGYWLAIAALVPLIPSRSRTSIGTIGALCSLGAIALFIFPVVQAKEVNDALPSTFDAHFGTEHRAHTPFSGAPRPSPLVFPDLIKPLDLPPVRYEQRTLATHEGQELTLDIYRPGYVHGPLPAVIVIHGGNWHTGDNRAFAALNAYLAGRDYVVAAINYRLAPRWPFPAGRDDVLSAVAYLKVFGPQLGVDTNQITLLGRAAGGQLALLAGYTAMDRAIRGVISIYGPSDLAFEYEHPAPRMLLDTRSVLERYLGGSPASAGDAYFAASPVNFVTAASPPTLIIHGMRDSTVWAEESARLDARLREANVKHLFVQLPWATHGCDKSFGGPCGQIVNYAVERFLDGITTAPTTQPSTRTAPKRNKAARRHPGPHARPGTQPAPGHQRSPNSKVAG